jgi:ketosteroid isomerase-like protein
MKRMLVGLALLAMVVGAQAQMSKSTEVQEAVTKMEQQWTTDAKAGNVDAIAPILAENFVNMDSDGSVRGKADSLLRMKGAKWQVNEISDVKVTVFGTTAVATGAWQGKGTTGDGKAVDAHEHWVDTWMKIPGNKWQCIASASTPAK